MIGKFTFHFNILTYPALHFWCSFFVPPNRPWKSSVDDYDGWSVSREGAPFGVKVILNSYSYLLKYFFKKFMKFIKLHLDWWKHDVFLKCWNTKKNHSQYLEKFSHFSLMSGLKKWARNWNLTMFFFISYIFLEF